MQFFCSLIFFSPFIPLNYFPLIDDDEEFVYILHFSKKQTSLCSHGYALTWKIMEKILVLAFALQKCLLMFSSTSSSGSIALSVSVVCEYGRAFWSWRSCFGAANRSRETSNFPGSNAESAVLEHRVGFVCWTMPWSGWTVSPFLDDVILSQPLMVCRPIVMSTILKEYQCGY